MGFKHGVAPTTPTAISGENKLEIVSIEYISRHDEDLTILALG